MNIKNKHLRKIERMVTEATMSLHYTHPTDEQFIFNRLVPVGLWLKHVLDEGELPDFDNEISSREDWEREYPPAFRNCKHEKVDYNYHCLNCDKNLDTQVNAQRDEGGLDV